MNTRSTQGTRRAKGVLAGLFAAVLASAIAACGSSSGANAGSASSGNSGGKQLTWIHGILYPKGDSGYQLMADAKGFYTKEGVHVDIKKFVGNVQLNQALVSGAIDSGDTAPAPTYDAVLRGAHLKIIGSTLPKVTYALIAKSDIKTLADLKGKTIGASAPGAYPDAVTRAMLAKKGIDPDSVKTVSAGADAQRFKALLAGRIDAAAVSDQFVPQAKKNPKIHVLAEAQNVVPDYPRFYIVANGDSLKKKPEAAVHFLAGEMRGLCYAVMHPKAEQHVAAKYSKLPSDDPGVVYVQQAIAKAHAASSSAAITMSRLKFLQNFRIQQGFQHGKVDLKTLVDSSYRQKALKLANLPKQCLDDPNANH